MKHPQQPIEWDGTVLRFKGNSIIEHLFDSGALDLNQLALMRFPPEDRQQLGQLLGYSLDGYCDLPYVNKKARRQMWRARKRFLRKDEARVQLERRGGLRATRYRSQGTL